MINISNHFFDKNHKDFISLAKENPEVEFLQIGKPHDGLFNCTTKCTKASLQIKNYYSLQVDRSEVVELLVNSDIFALTSRTEMFPLVILEAMAARIPFISYNVGCVRQLNGGIIVNNLKDFSHAVRNLENDDEERQALGEAGYNDVKSKYEISSVLNKYRSYLEEIYENS